MDNLYQFKLSLVYYNTEVCSSRVVLPIEKEDEESYDTKQRWVKKSDIDKVRIQNDITSITSYVITRTPQCSKEIASKMKAELADKMRELYERSVEDIASFTLTGVSWPSEA